LEAQSGKCLLIYLRVEEKKMFNGTAFMVDGKCASTGAHAPLFIIIILVLIKSLIVILVLLSIQAKRLNTLNLSRRLPSHYATTGTSISCRAVKLT